MGPNLTRTENEGSGSGQVQTTHLKSAAAHRGKAMKEKQRRGPSGFKGGSASEDDRSNSVLTGTAHRRGKLTLSEKTGQTAGTASLTEEVTGPRAPGQGGA